MSREGLPPDLSGFGYDVEHADLTGESLEWDSGRDGDLGTGSPLHEVDLSAGQHGLTVAVTDRLGMSGSAIITIIVGGTYPRTYFPLVLRQA